MPFKPRTFTLLALSISLFAFASLPATTQSGLTEMYNTTVTLFYYDNGNGTKGDVVQMPDNPQRVNTDPARAAPGMYTFSQVPSGQWYYLEADHQGNKWYTIFYMEDNAGTKTANVHIPPFSPVNATSAPIPTATQTPASTAVPPGTATPAIDDGPKASPGASPVIMLLSITASLYISRKKL